MPLYKCESCDFSSKILSHFNRHLNTRKHKNNIIINVGNLNNSNISSENPHFHPISSDLLRFHSKILRFNAD